MLVEAMGEETINCSPEKLKDGMYYREPVNHPCNPECVHYKKCLEECKVSSDYKFPVWLELPTTDDQVITRNCHWSQEHGDLRTWKKVN